MDAETEAALAMHDGRHPGDHTNLQASQCVCRGVSLVRPQLTGDVCAVCGGMAVRTGTCTTCTECGTTGGCG